MDIQPLHCLVFFFLGRGFNRDHRWWRWVDDRQLGLDAFPQASYLCLLHGPEVNFFPVCHDGGISECVLEVTIGQVDQVNDFRGGCVFFQGGED